MNKYKILPLFVQKKTASKKNEAVLKKYKIIYFIY